MLLKGIVRSMQILHIVGTHTDSRVDLICMWLTFVALIISSVNGRGRKAALKAYF